MIARIILAVSLIVALSAMPIGCGGGGGGGGDEEQPVVVAAPAPAPTPIEVTNCGDINVDLEEAAEIVEAANESDVDVEEILDEPTIPEFTFGQPTAKGVVIAACGSTVVTDDSISDDDSITIVTNATPAERLIAQIHAGEIASLEVHR